MALRQTLEGIATATLVVCALVVTTVVVRRDVLQQRPRGPRAPVNVRNWQVYVTKDEGLGEISAPVKIVVFSDYQCPYCKDFNSTLARLMAARPGKIYVAHRNFPLTQLHPYARSAALAAFCASKQGRFKAYHDLLFENQGALGYTDFTEVAARAGVPDVTSFRQCLATQEGAGLLTSDSTAAMRLQLSGTPLVMVNGWLFDGTPGFEDVERLLDGKASYARQP